MQPQQPGQTLHSPSWHSPSSHIGPPGHTGRPLSMFSGTSRAKGTWNSPMVEPPQESSDTPTPTMPHNTTDTLSQGMPSSSMEEYSAGAPRNNPWLCSPPPRQNRTDTPGVRDLCKRSHDYMCLVDLPMKAVPRIASRDYMCSVDPPEKFINIFFINHSLAPNFFLSIK